MSAGAAAVEDSGGDLATARLGTATDNLTLAKVPVHGDDPENPLGLLIMKGSTLLERNS